MKVSSVISFVPIQALKLTGEGTRALYIPSLDGESNMREVSIRKESWLAHQGYPTFELSKPSFRITLGPEPTFCIKIPVGQGWGVVVSDLSTRVSFSPC